MRAELPLQEPLGAELIGFGVKSSLRWRWTQVRARAQDHPGREFPPAGRERPRRLPHDERHHWASSQALADRRFEVLERREVLGLGRAAAGDPPQLAGQAIDDLRARHDISQRPG